MIKNKRQRVCEGLWESFPYLTWKAYADADINGYDGNVVRVWFDPDSRLWYTRPGLRRASVRDVMETERKRRES